MSHNQIIRAAVILMGSLLLHGCETPQPKPELLAPTEAQMKIRSLQSRSFETKDRNLAIRGVIAALQDLGFIIERANEPLGLVTAARFAEPNYYDVVSITVTAWSFTLQLMTFGEMKWLSIC